MRNLYITLSTIVAITASAAPNKNTLGPADPAQIEKVKAALPEKAPAKPSKSRKILMITRCEGFVHKSISIGAETIALLGDKTGAYSVDQTVEMDVFTKENLKQYDAVLFLNTTRLDPTPEQREALLDFARGGKGIIGIHAASDNFYQWEEGAKMMGGLFCGHPWTAGCTVQIKLDEPDHPINECFHGESFKVTDEIYQFKDPYSRENQRVLTSLDLSDPDTKAVKGGKPSKVTRTDGDFGVTWIRKEGKGRVFYCSMGHNNHIYWDTRILQHYLAGIQYALGDYDVPDKIVAADFSAIKTLTPEQGQEVRRPIEEQIFNSSQDQLPAIEQELLAVFKAKDTTLEGKQYTCRMLRHCASEASIPVIAPELLNQDMSHFVRLVLQEIDSVSVDSALIAALPQASDSLKPGIIGTLGKRKAASAVKVIAPNLKSTTAEIQIAAIVALGNIGGREAEAALDKASVKQEYARDRKHAQLQAAGAMDQMSALKVYGKFLEDGDDEIRCSALIGLAKTDAKKAVPAVLTNLDAKNKRIRNTSVGLLAELPAAELAASLSNLNSANQILVINTLAARHAVESETALLALTSSENAEVSKTAIQALAHVGTLSSAEMLLGKVATNKDAYTSLCALNGDGIDAAILAALKTEKDDRVASKLIECLAERQAPEALPYFIELANGEWNRLTAASISGMATLVSEQDFEIYMELMLKTQDEKKVKAIEKSMITSVQYQLDQPTCASLTAAAYPKSTGEAKYAIIRSLGAMGGPDANRILSEARNSTDPKAKDAAIRGLCSSPNPAVADELLKLAKTSDNETHKVLALRGYIRLANTFSDAETVVGMCTKAASLTERPAELKSIIACVKRIKTVEAVELISSMIDKPEMVTDCGWAIIEMSWHWRTRPACLEPINKIVTLSNDPDLLRHANDRIQQIEAEAK